MKYLIIKLILVAATVFVSWAGHAQSTAFTYQGRLDDGINPANGTYDLRFGVFNDDNGGVSLGSWLTNSATAVTNGLFTVTLDFGNQFPGSPRWIEVGVRTNGGEAFITLVPRQRLTATPYAVTAGTISGALPAGQITGTVTLAQLPAAVVTNGASGVNISGTFSGNGAGLTDISFSSIDGAAEFTLTDGFVFASSPGVGNSPYSVTAGDVNGDGKPDLITANLGADTLTVLTNNGSGGFALASSPGVGIEPYAVAAVDVNGDGKPDLISANYGANTLTVLTNNGSAGFVLASSPGVGSGPRSVTAADVNGDGKPDLISAAIFEGTLTVLTNNGSGGFLLAVSPGVGSGAESVTSADVNDDGKPDLISAHFGVDVLTVLTNNGSGGFVLAASTGVGDGPVSVTSADVNEDGKPDLISANYLGNTLTVLTNNGSGGFLLASSPGVGNTPRAVTAVDVNGDGKPDLISANYLGNTLTVLTNNGSGGFVLASSPGVGGGPYSVTAADVNGDGRPDLISANGLNNMLKVLFNATSFTGNFAGNGSGLTALNAGTLTGAVPPAALTAVPAANLTGAVPPATLTSVPAGSLTGTIADARLSANVAFLNASQTFGGANDFNASVTLNPPASLSFGSQTRQMINLWSTEYALGVQGGAGYFRSGGDFYWYLGGSHSDANGDAGGGVPLMTLKSSGNLGLGTSTPGYPLEVQNALAVGRFTTTNNGNGAVLILKNTATPTVFLGAINFDDATGTPGQIGYLASDQMTFRVAGADRMNLQAGGLYVNGALVPSSDRNVKEDFAAVDAQAILEKVAALPLQSWSYTNRPGVKHVGPMAQDFHAAFGLGEDDKHIATVDADGVALAAIQGLNLKLEQKLEQKQTEITELRQRLESLERLMKQNIGGVK